MFDCLTIRLLTEYEVEIVRELLAEWEQLLLILQISFMLVMIFLYLTFSLSVGRALRRINRESTYGSYLVSLRNGFAICGLLHFGVILLAWWITVYWAAIVISILNVSLMMTLINNNLGRTRADLKELDIDGGSNRRLPEVSLLLGKLIEMQHRLEEVNRG